MACYPSNDTIMTGMKQQSGFTLIEVLLALAVIAISLTALLKATSQDVANTQRIKDTTISHWVAMQGVSMIQTGLLKVPGNQEITQVTSMFTEQWYWRVKSKPTAIKNVDLITITVSKKQTGPFLSPLKAFRYNKHD